MVEIHGDAKPSRIWFSRGWLSPWWHLIELAGIRGGDEWCNRTIGLRLPGGCLFLNLNFPMRTTMCKECSKP